MLLRDVLAVVVDLRTANKEFFPRITATILNLTAL